MDVIKIASIKPPDGGRSKWARDLIMSALDMGLPYVPVPMHEAERFTVAFAPQVAAKLQAMAAEHRIAPADLCAGLIAAAQRSESEPAKPVVPEPSVGGRASLSRVRPILHPLVAGIEKAIESKGIAFAEASTGTGKGMMVAMLGLESAAAGKATVIAAPLQTLWQILDDLRKFEELAHVKSCLVLGRNNFVSQIRLRDWAVEENHVDLLQWIETGGKPLSEKAKKAELAFGIKLNWMYEDAQSLADDLPEGMMLVPGDDEGDESELVYQRLRKEAKDSHLILCSHHFLASHIQQSIMHQGRLAESEPGEEDASTFGVLPTHIDLLVVDEAHMLESAFAAVYSSTLHLHQLALDIENSKATGKKAAIALLAPLSESVSKLALSKVGGRGSVIGPANTFNGLDEGIRQAIVGLNALKIPAKDTHLRSKAKYAVQTLNMALNGYSTVKLEVSPVRLFPAITSGRSSLDKIFKYLWERVGAAALVSATLYTNGVEGGLSRWKLSVPKERVVFLPAVIPDWVTKPVKLQSDRVSIPPDDSIAWFDEAASKIQSIADDTKGGLLVLCTSYLAVIELGARLRETLGERLIVQDRSTGAKRCADRHKDLYFRGIKPVWLATGAAWTGMNLTDDRDGSLAQDDRMLSDLVLTRLPIGIARSLTHERRKAIQGFPVVTTEAVFQMRQGIGRAVRREGVPDRNLWILDSRIDGKEGWAATFRSALKPYSRAKGLGGGNGGRV
jgi:ATP-dependent DNA helicase DinG